jgi:hypothetical protein
MNMNRTCCIKTIVVKKSGKGVQHVLTRYGFYGGDHRDTRMSNVRCHHMYNTRRKPVYISKSTDTDL